MQEEGNPMRQTKDYGITARAVAAVELAKVFTVQEWTRLDDEDAANVSTCRTAGHDVWEVSRG